MDPERWRQVAHIYESALEREPAQRAAFVIEASGGDEDLRREVASLLAHDSTPVLIDQPMLETAADVLEEPPDLQPGMVLGPYRIHELLGAGGMGQVYRATDTRLNRSVAVKILPSSLAAYPQFLARFDREAQAIAALSHPHICTLHDICHHDSVDFLVMEYLEGETLAARLEKGALPLQDVLKYSIEIADALTAAHRHGITHRDLKPSNIILTRTGTKLLDFGLAKPATTPVAPGPRVPTMSPDLTGQDTILGTLQYMAPEQLEGKTADARTDIFALGAVVYEMLTGKKAFEGTSQASLIGAIMQADPLPIAARQPLTPPALDRVVMICLAKEPDDRWQSARDLAHELRLIAQDPNARTVAGAKSGRLAWALAVLFGICAATVTVLWVRSQGASTPVVRFVVRPPVGTSLPPPPQPIAPAISPDGQRLVFHVTHDGEPFLAIRSIDAVDASVLSGTAGARFPFWSPDSRAVAFFADGKLKRVNVSGGPIQTICDAETGFGGTWNRDEVIIFAPSAATGLFQVPAAGGQPIALTSLKTGERYHQRPQFLPDGRRFLYFAWPDSVYLGSLTGDTPTRVLKSSGMALYAASGHLLFVQDRTLVAQRFDLSRAALIADPMPIGEEITAGPPGGAGFSVSATGVLAYARRGPIEPSLGWLDRAGRTLSAIGPFPFAAFANVELSPTGTQIAMQTPPGPTPDSDIWIFDLVHGRPTQLTFATGADRRPIWSPDGRRLVFISARQGAAGLYQKVVGGEQREELLLPSEDELDRLPWPSDWTTKGIVYESWNDREGNDIWMLPVSGDRQPYPVVTEPGNQREAKLSPDGRWLAYASNASGRFEVFVQSLLVTGGKWRISTAGGSLPVWRRDGKELFFVAADGRLMVVSVEAGATTLRPGAPQPLFQTGLEALGARGSFGVSPDGQRFLLTIVDDLNGVASIVVVSNWTAALKE